MKKHIENMAGISIHGGKRKGAGRPKGEETKVIRVPVGCIEEVKFVISRYRDEPITNDKFLSLKKERNKHGKSLLPDTRNSSSKKHISSEKSKKTRLDKTVIQGFKDLPRAQRRALVKIHGSLEKAAQAYENNRID